MGRTDLNIEIVDVEDLRDIHLYARWQVIGITYSHTFCAVPESRRPTSDDCVKSLYFTRASTLFLSSQSTFCDVCQPTLSIPCITNWLYSSSRNGAMPISL